MKNDEFIRGKVPITKEEVRAISLNKLDLKNGTNWSGRNPNAKGIFKDNF